MLNSPEEVFYSVIAGVILMVFFAIIFILSIVRYQRKIQKHIQEKQRLQSEFAQTLLQAQLEIKEHTLQHLAYELHDNLGQIASLIKINLNTLQLSNQYMAAQKIEDTKELVRQLISDLKSLSLNLNSDKVVQQGIVKSLEYEVDRLNKTGQFAAVLRVEGTVPILDSNTAVILYRMAQEIINNIVKHSEAKRMDISIEVTEKLFTLVCFDDGVGFDAEEKINSGGSGLTTLRNRAKLINAQLAILSAHNKGTRISIELLL